MLPEGTGLRHDGTHRSDRGADGRRCFQIDPPDPVKRVVRVRVRGTVPQHPPSAQSAKQLWSLATGDTATLYNRVMFAPIQKADDHELTLFWEVGFPFGDLQWLL